MPAETLTKHERIASAPIPSAPAADEALRDWARKHLERVRRLKFHVTAYALGMIVLTPLWALVEWQSNGGFERWSENSNPGDWEPWILYVAGGWGLFVAVLALRTYFDRPTTEAEIDRAVAELTSRG